jgi:trigger factor
LKIEKEFRDDHQVKLTVELDPEPFESAKRRAARKIAKRVKIPGFRPGKAPYGVILRQVGEAYIVEEALELLIEEQYPEIIKEADITPYGPGKLDQISQLDPPTFEFIVPLDVEVELGDYKSIRIPYEVPETSAEDVDNEIEQIREQNASRESIEKPAEVGDIVFIRISGSRTDIEDETEAMIIEERFSSAIVQEGEDENEWPYPGFSKELVGISVNEEKNLTHQFPDDHSDDKLQGAEVAFKVFVTNIQTKFLPDIDDELAKSVSEFNTIDEWKTNLKESLTERNTAEYAENYENQLIDEIISLSSIKYPPQIIEREKEVLLKNLEYRLSQQGLTKDFYLQIRGLDENGLNDEITPLAKQRVERALVLIEISKAEEIKADPEKISAEMGKTVQAISRDMTPNEAKKFVQSDYIPSITSNIVADMVTQSTIDFLLATAKGENWPTESEIITDEAGESEVVDPTQSATLLSPTPDQAEAETEPDNRPKPDDIPERNSQVETISEEESTLDAEGNSLNGDGGSEVSE